MVTEVINFEKRRKKDLTYEKVISLVNLDEDSEWNYDKEE